MDETQLLRYATVFRNMIAGVDCWLSCKTIVTKPLGRPSVENNTNLVLIVEDHGHTATRLSKSVAAHPELSVCHVASTLQSGLLALERERPRIVLTDLGLPDGDGTELIKASTAADWVCDSIVISVFGDEQRVLNAIRAGARGYVSKSSLDRNIAQDVISVIEGGSPISPKIARHLLSLVPTQREAVRDNSGEISLTERETEILHAVAKGYKRHEISEQLSISTGTVGNHINNIYKKLEVRSSIDALSRANKMGLL